MKNFEDILLNDKSTIRDCYHKLINNKKGICFVCNEKNELKGSITDGDIRKYLLDNSQIDLDFSIKSIMNTSPKYFFKGEKIKRQGNINIYPILNKNMRFHSYYDFNVKEISIGKNKISKNSKSYIIAEIGNNHNGSKSRAKELIDRAKQSNVNAVKFQLRNLDKLYQKSNNKDSNDLGVEYTLNLLNKYNLGFDDLEECFEYAKSLGLDVICTPFDEESLDLLVEYNIDAIKIASADLTNHSLVEKAAISGIPIIISTGMSTIDEINSTVSILKNLTSNFILLHCNSTYPTPFKDINLKFVKRLKKLSPNGIVGYSGHERGWHIPIAGITIGIKVIEKHFTTDRNLEGNDHKVSLLPEEMSMMVSQIREVEEAISKDSNIREISQGEMMNRENLAKSLFYKKKLTKGTILKREMIEIKSPGNGIQPNNINHVLNKQITKDIKKGSLIEFTDFIDSKLNGRRNYKIPGFFGIPVRFHDLHIADNSNINLVEFHLTNEDLNRSYEQLSLPKNIKTFTVHAPELCEGDNLLDLSRQNKNYEISIEYLKRVIDLTKSLKLKFDIKNKIPIIVNAGGFSQNGFLNNNLKKEMYENIYNALEELKDPDVEIIIQTMPPYPWHFGGQSYHNLFVELDEILNFCLKYDYRICFDTSHSYMAALHTGEDFENYVKKLKDVTCHYHISDAIGLDGEGIQIGKGEIDWGTFFKIVFSNQEVSFVPEIWQGHKESGNEFYESLSIINKYIN